MASTKSRTHMLPGVSLFQDKGAINTKLSFATLLSGTIPQLNTSFDKIFDRFDAILRKQKRRVTPDKPDLSAGALGNVHGAWYAWLIAISARNFHADYPDSLIAIPLPNVATLDISKLYTKELAGYIRDLREKVSANDEVELITSNPDFVIIDINGLQLSDEFLAPITEISVETIDAIDQQYRRIIGNCDFYRIRGYASVKRSLRPDRRLQIAHEGSLMKAIYRHLQTRLWILSPPGIKYYGITSQPVKGDTKALRTVATHSITTVLNTPERAVDELFTVNSMQQAMLVLSDILSPSRLPAAPGEGLRQ